MTDKKTFTAEEIKKIIDECYARCEAILKENASKLEKTAQLLLEKEKVDEAEFDALFSENQTPAEPSAEENSADSKEE